MWPPQKPTPERRRLPLEALEVEMRIAAGEHALQALLQCVSEHAGTLEAHEAEPGRCTRLWPMGWAAMKVDCAPRGTGDGGPALIRADGVVLPRERTRRGRDSGSRFGTLAVARTCDRTPGAPGVCPLDGPVNLPARGDA
jgi:hypothetical protein